MGSLVTRVSEAAPLRLASESSILASIALRRLCFVTTTPPHTDERLFRAFIVTFCRDGATGMTRSKQKEVHRTERMTAIARRSAIARHYSRGIGCSSQVAQPTEPCARLLLDIRRVPYAVEHISQDLSKVSVTHIGCTKWTRITGAMWMRGWKKIARLELWLGCKSQLHSLAAVLAQQTDFST